MKAPFFCTLLALCAPLIAAPHSQQVTYQLSYTQLQMPQGVKPLGILGLHGHVNLTPNWYAGLGFYGGVKGESGGYFAMSLDGGYQHKITGPLWVNIGANIGAGGGRHTAVGGGLYVQPHAGLSWHFKRFNLGANYNWLKFTDGQIESSQIGLTLSVPTEQIIAPFSDAGSSINVTPHTSYMALLGQAYVPNKGTRDASGNISDHTTEFVGAEYGRFITPRWFLFANITGAFHGRGNGYANALIGAGFHYPLTTDQRLSLNAKLAAGSGGGGNVNTGGGLILSPMLGLEYQLTGHVALEADGSYLTAPEGDFNNKVVTLALQYYFKNPLNVTTNQTLDGLRLRLSNETYLSPKSKTGVTNPDMQLINLNIDYWLTHHWYITGQTAFAYKGKQTGGYFSGLIGPGFQWPLYKNLSIYGEALIGTAGGAGLDIAEGALAEPVLGINYQITTDIGILASIGRLIALKGAFSSTTLNAGLSYRFAG
jgi:hypothetical protein